MRKSWSGFMIGFLFSMGFSAAAMAAPCTGKTPLPLDATHTGLTITEGECSTSGTFLTGSYFQMFSSVGAALSNFNSPCSKETTFTPLEAGSEGGLDLSGTQDDVTPGVLEPGRIIGNFTFFGTDVEQSTNAVDPQCMILLGLTPTDTPVPAACNTVDPEVCFDTGDDLGDGNPDTFALLGDMRAWNSFWNGNHFNQGSPKVDGTYPTNTSAAFGTEPVSGTYNTATGDYSMIWKSTILGGAFDTFIGEWKLEGIFTKIVPPPPPNTSHLCGGASPCDDAAAVCKITPSAAGTAPLQSKDCKMILSILAGSLSSDVLFTVTELTPPFVHKGNFGKAYKVEPNGTALLKPARICLRYTTTKDHAAVPKRILKTCGTPGDACPLRLGRSESTGDTRWKVVTGSTVDVDSMDRITVCGEVTSFSQFGVVSLASGDSGSLNQSGGCAMVDPRSGGGTTPPAAGVVLLFTLFLPIVWILGRKGLRYMRTL